MDKLQEMFTLIYNNQIILFTDDAIFMDGRQCRYEDISSVKYSEEKKTFLFRCEGRWHRIAYEKEEEGERLRGIFRAAADRSGENPGSDEYARKAARALIDGTEYGEYFRRLLQQEEYDRRTAISPYLIDDISDSCCIVLLHNVYDAILEAHRTSMENDTEVPFFLTGAEEKRGIIVFHEAKCPKENGEDNAALQPVKGTVRCCGRTLPPAEEGDRHSFADLASAVEHTLLNSYLSDGIMRSVDLLVTTKGDINFLKYEDSETAGRFLKYQNVFVYREDGTLERLPAYDNGWYNVYPLKKG